MTTNIAEYNFFRTLIENYKSEVEKEMKVYQTSSASHVLNTPAISPEMTPEKEKSNKDYQLPSLKPQREFVGSVELNPKLNVLGDMTPKVETVLGWLGINDKELIPRATHDALADTLETMLISCANASELIDKLLEEK